MLDYSTTKARRIFLTAAALVAGSTQVPFRELVKTNRIGRHARGDATVLSRNMAMYLTVVAGDVRQAALARALDRPRKAIVKACRQVEDARDAPEIDALLDRLEALF